MSLGIASGNAVPFSKIESGASSHFIPFIIRVNCNGGTIEARACLLQVLHQLESIQ
jgi:hypothetical protein